MYSNVCKGLVKLKRKMKSVYLALLIGLIGPLHKKLVAYDKSSYYKVDGLAT